MAQFSNFMARMDARSGVPLVHLADAARGIEVEIVPSLGNRTIALRVRGENFLYVPSDDPLQLRQNRHINGIPFLAPWANRMPEGFWANGKQYRFGCADSLRPDPNGIPIHGLLTASPLWQVAEVVADETSARVTSRLEFWKYPALMANWPFAHEYEMTHRLAEGVLEISVAMTNRAAEPMPVAIGFHPYFQLPGVPITHAAAHIPARLHVETDARLVATGEMKPVDLPSRVALAERRFDDGFTGLAPEPFFVEGDGKRVEVSFGPKYKVAIVYAPPGQDYICFEPMTAITNGVNLAHAGKYADLQMVGAGEIWRESFQVRATYL